MKKVWIQVKIEKYWSSEDGDSAGSIKEIHTIKINPDCDDLKKECKKELKRLKIKFNKITDYKFV